MTDEYIRLDTPSATALSLLKELVVALDKTYWSSWQSTARFDHQLNRARNFIAEQEANHE